MNDGQFSHSKRDLVKSADPHSSVYVRVLWYSLYTHGVLHYGLVKWGLFQRESKVLPAVTRYLSLFLSDEFIWIIKRNSVAINRLHNYYKSSSNL